MTTPWPPRLSPAAFSTKSRPDGAPPRETIAMEKLALLYTGKAKSVYTTDNPDQLVILFRNDTSALDGQRIEQLERKGMVNNKFNAFIMERLAAAGIPTHFVQRLSDTESLVK